MYLRSETYTPVIEDKKVKLGEEDIDTLNMAMLYNSGDGGGVIHVSGINYINDLYGNLDDENFFRELYLGDTLDEYPFPTKLSVLKVRKEAEKEKKKREKDPVRPFINAIVDYDDEHLDTIDKKDHIKIFSKRIKDAEKILYGNNDDSRKKMRLHER